MNDLISPTKWPRTNRHWASGTQSLSDFLGRLNGCGAMSDDETTPIILLPESRSSWAWVDVSQDGATGATVPEQYVQGVRNFLVDALDPIIGASGGSVFWSVPVNLPRLSQSCV
jgi:hypothetical protein